MYQKVQAAFQMVEFSVFKLVVIWGISGFLEHKVT